MSDNIENNEVQDLDIAEAIARVVEEYRDLARVANKIADLTESGEGLDHEKLSRQSNDDFLRLVAHFHTFGIDLLTQAERFLMPIVLSEEPIAKAIFSEKVRRGAELQDLIASAEFVVEP